MGVSTNYFRCRLVIISDLPSVIEGFLNATLLSAIYLASTFLSGWVKETLLAHVSATTFLILLFSKALFIYSFPPRLIIRDKASLNKWAGMEGRGELFRRCIVFPTRNCV